MKPKNGYTPVVWSGALGPGPADPGPGFSFMPFQIELFLFQQKTPTLLFYVVIPSLLFFKFDVVFSYKVLEAKTICL